MSLTDQQGTVVCEFCETPYEYTANLLTSEYVWVRRCKAKCRRAQPEQRPKFVAFDESGGSQG